MCCKFILSFIIVISSIICGISCGNGHKETYWQRHSREILESLINQPVRMPDNIPVCYPDSNAYRQLMGSNVKVMFSVDISCGACLTKFHYWSEFVDRFEQRHGIKPPVLAVIFAANCNEDTKEFINEKWSHEWIYDPEGDFTFNNEIDDDRFQAILLDANDTIRLVGNPMFNDKLGQLYEKAIIERLH